MPGIVGLITKMPREQAVEQLVQMVRTLRPRVFLHGGNLGR